MRHKRLVSILLVFFIISLIVLPACAKEGPPKLEFNINSKGQVMTFTYKAYGIPSAGLWLAKTVCKNTGTGPMYNLRVEYKIPGYIDWIYNNPYPKLIPGETIVDCFYPSFPATITNLESKTPSNLTVRFTYEDAEGKTHEDNGTVSLELLGRNDIISTSLKTSECLDWKDFNTNLILFTAFITPQDPPLRGFADLANKAAGGIGASTNDQSALKVIEACFRTMHDYGITYKHPTAELWSTSVMTQHIQYPRDTIREDSGTCVDLAILLAAMCESLGLSPYLFVMPGHVIPIIGLPSGTLLPVESTMVGEFGQQVNFQQVTDNATKTVNDEMQKGQYYLVSAKQMREIGVVSPELPPLSADILNTWLKAPAQTTTQTTTLPPSTTTQTQVGGMPTYTDPSGRFAISYPQGWTQQTQQNIVGWTSPDTQSDLLVGINLFGATSADTILQQYSAYVLQMAPDFRVNSKQNGQVGQYPAIVALTSATINGIPYSGVVVTVVSSGNGLVVECSCPTTAWNSYQVTFEQILNSFMVK